MEVNTHVTGQPRRHVARTSNQSNVLGNDRSIPGGIERQSAPSGSIGRVATDAALLEDRLHVFGEPSTGHLVRGNLTRKVSLGIATVLHSLSHKSELEPNPIISVNQTCDVDRADTKVGSEHSGRDRSNHGTFRDRNRALKDHDMSNFLHRQLAGEGDVHFHAFDQLIGKPGDLGGNETGIGPMSRLEKVVPQSLVPQSRTRVEHLDVDHNLTHRGPAGVTDINQDVAADNRANSMRCLLRPSQSLGDDIANLRTIVGRHPKEPGLWAVFLHLKCWGIDATCLGFIGPDDPWSWHQGGVMALSQEISPRSDL